MDTTLLKKLGNIKQIAGINESVLIGGRCGGLRVAEFYNASGLRFTLLPDRCLDIYELSYKGVNLSFQTKNGPGGAAFASPFPQEFPDQWPGGMLSTCGLDNVGAGYDNGAIYPMHGRIMNLPAEQYGTKAYWQGDDYYLEAHGEIHQARLCGRHLSLKRNVETSLNARALRLNDTITNYEPDEEPVMLLYHFNFGYPLLDECSKVYTSQAGVTPRNELSTDAKNMMPPVDGRGEELYFYKADTKRAWGALINPELQLGAYIAFDTENLPFFIEWKNMRSHDYVLAIEPCNCTTFGRQTSMDNGSIAKIAGYSSLDYSLELGVLDGEDEINAFLKNGPVNS